MEAKRTMIASQLIIEAGEQFHKRPTQLKFEELVDVVQAVVKNCSIPAVVGQSEQLVCENCGEVEVRDEGDWCDKCLNEGF